MKKPARIISVMLCLIMITALFTGCHNAKPLSAVTIPEEFDTSKKYEITFWAKNDTNNVQKKIYLDTIEKFQELYPNITVNMRQYTDYNEIYNDVITNIATHTTPNVCITYPDHIATYLSGENVVVPLDMFMDNEKYGFGGTDLKYTAPNTEDIIAKFLEEGRFDSCYYALPFMRSTEAVYINKDLVEKLGYTLPDVLTWDFVFEVSEAAMKKNADDIFELNGQKVLIPFIYKSTDNMMIQMLRQKNAGYSTESGEILLFNDDTKQLLYDISDHAATKAFSTFKISSYPGNYLNAGQCIFAIDSTAGATWMGSDAPLLDIPEDALVKFETVVMAVPQFDPEHPQMISQGPSLCIFNKEDPGEVLASWLFAQYLLTNDVQIAYAETEGYVPVTTSAREAAEYKDYLSRSGEDNDTYYDVKIAATKLLLDNTDNTFTTPVFNGSASLRTAAGQLIEDVTNARRRKQTVDEEFMANEYEHVTSLYRLNEITASGNGKRELGALPKESKALLISLVVIWICIGAYLICESIKKKKQNH